MNGSDKHCRHPPTVARPVGLCACCRGRREARITRSGQSSLDPTCGACAATWEPSKSFCSPRGCLYGVSRPLEPTAGIPLLVVGCVFLSLGVLGRLAGATEPCGCFGDANSAPLGLVGVTFGAGLIVITVAGLFVSGYVPTLDWSAPAALLSLVVGASVWTLYRQKSLVHFSWSYVRRTR